MPDHPYAMPAGRSVRHFRIERILGSNGGCSILYLASNVLLYQTVAIKELFPQDLVTRDRDGCTVVPRNDGADAFEVVRERFLAEASLRARFHHRALLAIYDAFEENGTAYVVTAYLKGESFEQSLCQHGPVPEVELRAFASALLEGLESIHARGFLHLDVTSENIHMEPRDGQNCPVLMRLAPVRISTEEKTKSLTAVLTPGYAPFEQYTTNGRQGPWTDLYALGAVLFRAITGAPPENSADRTDVDTVPVLVDNPPPGYSRDFLATIDKALRMRREERWQSCQEWLDALSCQPSSVVLRQPWYRRLLVT